MIHDFGITKGALVLDDKSFLVTGGTGSFGKTFVKKLLNLKVAEIVILSRDETKQHYMKQEFSDTRIRYILGDIRNYETVLKATRNIDFIFHAAALKQVPTSESFPWEFVQTNIQGSHNILEALQYSNVKKAVFLSTDKAVYPLNAMGMTKALMEKLVRSGSYSSSTINIITRYGNVIGSRGSVIPHFIESIKKSKSVGVTHPEMTRFMMSLDDSVDLVLHALEHGESGDLFVRKSPAASVATIIEALCLILEVQKIQIENIGVRAGEKMHETLLTAEERYVTKESENFFQVPMIKNNQINNSKYGIEFTSHNTKQLNAQELAGILLNIPLITKSIK